MKWPTPRLGEVAEVRIGPFGSLLHKHDYLEGGVPLVNPMHLDGGKIVPDRRHAIAPEKASQLANYRLAEGDVVLGRRGEMGRCAVVGHSEKGFLCGTGSLIVRPGPLLSSRFLSLMLSSPGMVRAMEQASLGTTMPNLNGTIVADLRVALPPLGEQRRIAAILDQADALRARRHDVLNRIGELGDAIFIDMFGDPATQDIIETAPLGDLVDFYSGGTPSKSRPEYWEGHIPWFSPKDMKAQSLWDSADHLGEVALGAASVKMIPADTVVIVVRGMILAHTVPISLVRVSAAINQDLKALLPRTSISPFFLQAALRVQHNRILGMVSTAAHGTKRIETQSLRQVRIPRPGEAAEEDFCLRVRASQRVAENMTRAVSDVDLLFESLQSRAFSGEL